MSETVKSGDTQNIDQMHLKATKPEVRCEGQTYMVSAGFRKLCSSQAQGAWAAV